MREVLVELRPRLPHRRAVARADDLQRQLAQPLERVQVAREVLGDEHAALPEDGVAREAGAVADEREVVRRMAGHGVRDERAEALALGQPHVRREPPRGDRWAPEPLAQREHALDVVQMIVGDRDPAGAAAGVDLRGHRVEVLREVGAGVDHPGRVAADDPGVRARERVRAGIAGAHARDVQPRELGRAAHRGTSR